MNLLRRRRRQPTAAEIEAGLKALEMVIHAALLENAERLHPPMSGVSSEQLFPGTDAERFDG